MKNSSTQRRTCVSHVTRTVLIASAEAFKDYPPPPEAFVNIRVESEFGGSDRNKTQLQ